MSESNRLESELNSTQLDAVTYCDGPSLVIAGAGSGKTRVLTYKIAYLLQHGVEPWRILALTFTNKAAKEMNERIAQLCGNDFTRYLWSGTFHSLFVRILRKEAHATGYPNDFTIYDAADSKSLIKTIVKEMQLDDKVYKPNFVAGRISEAKNHLIVPSAYQADASIGRRDQTDGLAYVGKIYAVYQQRLRQSGAMDFDDLLLNMFLLLRDNPEIQKHYMERFQYILVDEYQDTNMAQHRILALLTTPTSRICVVGDDAQSIYGFRGADIKNILEFQKDYPTARIIKLECNYRSTQNIVEAANCIIRHNKNQIKKNVYAAGERGDKLQLFSAKTDKEEAQKVVARVIKLHRKGIGYDEIALLYRTNAQSRSFEEALQSASIPYRIYGGLSFYQRKEIKDVMAYLRLACNPDDEEALRRVINYPARGIGATTVSKLQLAAAQMGVSMWQVAHDPQGYGVSFNAGTQKKLQTFCSLIESFHGRSGQLSAYDITYAIVRESGIAADFLGEKTAENISRQENVDEFLGSIKSYEKEMAEAGEPKVLLADFLSTVALLTDSDQKSDETPRVTLMTVHASKGLEFNTVFVTGLEEDLFPNANARLYPREMEEERRLFYVAVTRAKEHCFLSYSSTRFKWGNLECSEPSSFIDEIDEQYIESEAETAHPEIFSKARSKSWGSASSSFGTYSGGRLGRAPWEEDDSRDSDRKWNRSQRGSWRNNDASDSMRSDELQGFGSGHDSRRYDEPVRTPRRVVPPAVPMGMKKVGSTPKSAPSASAGNAGGGFPVGTRIEHERFGKGTVLGVEGTGDSMKLRVDFDKVGCKNLLVKFAKFRKM